MEAALGWYDAIVAAVTDLTAGRPAAPGAAAAVAALGEAIRGSLNATISGLEERELASNAAVMLFGGTGTTEAMIANAVAHLLADPSALAFVPRDPGASPARSRSRSG